MISEVTQADRDFAILACRLTGWEGVAQRLERGWKPDRDTNEGKLLDAAVQHRLTAQSGEGRKLFCETCGDDVHEVLCPKCAKWWEDNSPSEGRSGAGEDAALKLVAGYVDYTTESKDRWEQGKAAGYRELGSIVAAALNARQSGEGEREALREALAEAYRKGATDVHNYWVNNPGEPPRGDPEFGESASDYAAGALVIFDSAAALRATDDAGGA